MAELRHPHIVELLAAGEIDELPYVVAEFADSGSLAERIANHPDSFSPRQAAWLVCKITEAVEEAHSTMILHRDIKPGNVLLKSDSVERTEGLGFQPLLTDFGLSKRLADQQTTSPLTIEGEILGTLSYMSPEQIRCQPLKIPSDIFSLGVVLHELVYGQHPFVGDDDFQTLSNIVGAEPSKAASRQRRVPSALAAIIAKCLRKNAGDRYLHASDLAKDLEHFLQGKPISISPPTVWQSLVSWGVAHPIRSTFLATILGCAITGVFLLSYEWKIQRDLARSSQLLADERSKVSQLFFDSIRASNSSMNDSILAGKRVSPTDLLQILDRQVPLLESALALNPSDYSLIRQLEIMYHYKSLCHDFSANLKSNQGWESEKKKAIEARKKSLDYLNVLIERFPEDDRLRISQLNGEYLMSALMTLDGTDAERVKWRNKAIASADDYLVKHPAQLDVLETAVCLRLDRASEMAADAPESGVDELRAIIDRYIVLLDEFPGRSSLLTYTARGLTLYASLLLQLDRDSQAFLAFQQLDTLATERRETLKNESHFSDALISGYAIYCESLARKGLFSKLLSVVDRWQDWIDFLNVSSYVIIQNHHYHSHRFEGSEFIELFPRYYRWLALNGITAHSQECQDAFDDLKTSIGRCQLRSSSDLMVFVNGIDDVDRKKFLETLIESSTAPTELE
jgi:serine/threonine protein kinase